MAEQTTPMAMTIAYACKLLKYVGELVAGPVLNGLVLEVIPPSLPLISIDLTTPSTALTAPTG